MMGCRIRIHIEHRADGRRVDDGHRPALAVDERVVDADPRRRAHLGQLVQVVRQLRAEAAEAEVVHADDEVAAELLAEDLADGVGLIDAASTEMPATRATPTTSAAAVRAVRLGLRMAFSVAMRAGHPLEPR